MNTVVIANVCKNETNLNSLLNKVGKDCLVQNTIVSSFSNVLFENKAKTLVFEQSTSYSSLILSSIEAVLKDIERNTDENPAFTKMDDVIAIIPDSVVFSDMLISFAIESFKDSRVSVVFFGPHDNKIVSLDNLNDEDYNLYKVFNKRPSINDLENALFIRKTVLIRVYKEICSQKNDFYLLNSHYLMQFIYDFVRKYDELSVSIVNERLSLSKDYLERLDGKENKVKDKVIAKKLGIEPVLKLSSLQKIFSITSFNRHTVITLLGMSIPFKVRHKPKFPRNSIEFDNKDKFIEKELIHKRACLFASFTAKGKVSSNTLDYLKNLRQFNDYIVYVADSKALPDTIKTLCEYADCVIINRHEEYDFGSYKRAFEFLNSKGFLDKIDSLLICNDSVDFVGCSEDLKEIFDTSSLSDAYALCKATYGFGNKIKRHKYEWTKNPHLQSYFLVLRKNVFRANYFKNFISSVKHLKNKTQIIKDYEMGLSELLKNNNVKLDSYYPYDESNIVNPYAIYLDPHVDHPIFVKHMLSK